MSRSFSVWRLIGYGVAAAAVVSLGAVGVYVAWQRALHPPLPPLERQWDALVSVLAGDGEAGVRDGDADHARFAEPFGIAVTADGTLYVSDAGDAQGVRRITRDGAVSTVARGFNTPSGVAVDPSGNLYVADTGNHVIKRVTPAGEISIVAGDGRPGYADGPAVRARFNGPIGVAVDEKGRVIVADTYNDRIRRVDADGMVRTIAGSADTGSVDGPADQAQFNTPCGVAVGRDGSIYVADTGNDAIRRIAPDGTVGTVDLGSGESLFHPLAIAADGGTLFVTGENNRVVEVTPSGGARTVAGSRAGFADGTGPGARFRAPSGIAVVAPGRLVVADTRNRLVRLVAAASQQEQRIPASPWIAPAFDADAFNLLPLLWPLEPMVEPLEITGTMGEPRGGEGSERFHAGVDIRGERGTSVYAVRDGVVSSPIAVSAFETLNESVRIGSLAYVHVRVGRRSVREVIDPSKFVAGFDERGRLSHVRIRRGTRFTTGEQIGTLNAFNHAHLNIGWPGEEYNPLQFRLVHFEDTVPPTIAPAGVGLFTESGEPITRREGGRLVISGRVQVVVDAWDQANGNAPRRRLGLYALGYQVLDSDGRPAAGFEMPKQTIFFDRFAADDEAARVVFAAGSGIPFYGNRRSRFLYAVTNTFRHGVAARATWDSSSLAPGHYILRVIAADVRGNVAVANRDLPISVVPANGHD